VPTFNAAEAKTAEKKSADEQNRSCKNRTQPISEGRGSGRFGVEARKTDANRSGRGDYRIMRVGGRGPDRPWVGFSRFFHFDALL
jgi:hypothetical protein